MINILMKKKSIFKILLLFVLSVNTAFAYEVIRLNVSQGIKKEKYDAFNSILEVDLETTGFIQKDIHIQVENAYKRFYGTTYLKDGMPNPKFKKDYIQNLENLSFITISNEKRMMKLLVKEPTLGGFAPLNYLTYKYVNDEKTYVATLTPKAMLDITNVKDEEVRKIFTKYVDKLSAVSDEGMRGKVEFLEIKKLNDKTMMKFEIPFDRGDDILDAKIDFMNKFESVFKGHDYIIAGKRDFHDYWVRHEMKQDRFDEYWVYSLCHFTFSYTVFNVWKRPELGVLAPCSMYMYVEQGGNTLHVGMPSVKNWITIGEIKDPKKIKYIKDMDEKIRGIMISLGAKEI